MMNLVDLTISSIFIGIGATIVMDIMAILLKLTFNIPFLNYSLVGRWIGHFPQGTFMHKSIAEASPVKGETVLGWIAHYSIGITFAFFMLLMFGDIWLPKPTLALPVIYGLITTLASWILLQPAFGQGFAAAKAPKPWSVRARNLMTHAIYGLGIYLAALAHSYIFG